MKLDDRKKRILQAVVEDYIAAGEPVGSRSVFRKHDLGVSSATIRNEMADLEELGFLDQPHTSAGRIPSDYGYRYYVDNLMPDRILTSVEENFIRFKFNQKMRDLEEVARHTSEVLSELTNYTALFLGPLVGRRILEQVNLLMLGPGDALLVVVINGRFIKHKALKVPPALTQQDLARITSVFNSRLKGLAWEELRQSTLQEIYDELLQYRRLVNVILEALEQSATDRSEEKVYLGGMLNIFSQPEFQGVERLRELMQFLSQDNDVLKELLSVNQEKSGAGPDVIIGNENRYQQVKDCSIVAAGYGLTGELSGRFGILGPTRMDYPRVITVVRLIAELLSGLLEPADFMEGQR